MYYNTVDPLDYSNLQKQETLLYTIKQQVAAG